MNESQKRTIHYSFKATPEEDEIIQKKMELGRTKQHRRKSADDHFSERASDRFAGRAERANSGTDRSEKYSEDFHP